MDDVVVLGCDSDLIFSHWLKGRGRGFRHYVLHVEYLNFFDESLQWCKIGYIWPVIIRTMCRNRYVVGVVIYEMSVGFLGTLETKMMF